MEIVHINENSENIKANGHWAKTTCKQPLNNLQIIFVHANLFPTLFFHASIFIRESTLQATLSVKTLLFPKSLVSPSVRKFVDCNT